MSEITFAAVTKLDLEVDRPEKRIEAVIHFTDANGANHVLRFPYKDISELTGWLLAVSSKGHEQAVELGISAPLPIGRHTVLFLDDVYASVLPADRAILMILAGKTTASAPKTGWQVALSPDQATKLANSLIEHRDMLPKT